MIYMLYYANRYIENKSPYTYVRMYSTYLCLNNTIDFWHSSYKTKCQKNHSRGKSMQQRG